MMNEMMLVMTMPDRDPSHHPIHHCYCVMMMMSGMLTSIMITDHHYQCHEDDE